MAAFIRDKIEVWSRKCWNEIGNCARISCCTYSCTKREWPVKVETALERSCCLRRESAASWRPAIQPSVRAVKVVTSSSVRDRKSTRLNSSHQIISYAVFCLKKKTHLCSAS